MGVAVGEGVRVAVGIGDSVCVGDGEAVDGGVGVGDCVAGGGGVGEDVGVGMAVGVAVSVGIGEGVALWVGTGEGVAAGEGVWVGDGVGGGEGPVTVAAVSSFNGAVKRAKRRSGISTVMANSERPGEIASYLTTPASWPTTLVANGVQLRGIFKKCVNSQAVYLLSEQHGLEAQERR